MRIATFNIENLDDNSDHRNPKLADRIPVLRQNLQRIKADILCLQEVHAQETERHTPDSPDRKLFALEQLLDGTEYQGRHIVHTKTNSGQPYDKRNLVVISHLPVLETNQYRNDLIDNLQYRKVTALPEESAKDLSWERPIQHLVLNLGQDDKLHIINLHLKSRLASNVKGQKHGFEWKSASGWAEGYFLSSIKRVGQALETRILIDQILDNEPAAKILVCGDLNAEPGEVPVEAMLGRVENTNSPQLRDRALISCSRGIPESIRYSHLHHGQGNLLDHMLISQSLLASFKQAEIHNENLHDESLPFTYDNKYPESDHAPFVAEFDL